MGHIISPVSEAISNIWWIRPKPGRAFKVEKAVLIPKAGQRHDEDLLLMKLEGGGYACSRDLTKYAYLPGEYPWLDPVMKGLVALGAITQADMDAHVALCKQRTAERDLEWRAEQLWTGMKELGLEPTKAQRQFVVDHAKQGFLREHGLVEPEPYPSVGGCPDVE